MTSREKITSAQTSANLGEKPVGELGDVDIIRAAGMAAQGNPLGLSVWRWRYCGDRRSMYTVAEGLVSQGYGVALVHRVLMHLDRDVCPACFGRGFKTMVQAPVLSDDVCGECRGTGRRELLGKEEQALADTIKVLEQEIATAIMRKLSVQMDL
jgi:hypothetical protein